MIESDYPRHEAALEIAKWASCSGLKRFVKHALPGLRQAGQQRIKISFGGAKVNDASAKYEFAIKLGAGQEDFAIALHNIQQLAVQCVQVLNTFRREPEARHAQRPSRYEFEVGVATNLILK